MKTVFVTIGDSFVARNILQTPFWVMFKKRNPDMRIVLIVPPEKKEYYARVFGGTSVVVEGVNPAFHSYFARVLAVFMRSGLKTRTNLWSKMRSYYRGESSLAATYLKRAVTFLFGGLGWYKRFLRFLFLKNTPEKDTKRIFDEYNPDIAFVISLTNFDFDVPIAAEASRRGVCLVGMVRSWDNLSSHGLLRVVPDTLILQNEFLRSMAIRYQAIKEKETLLHVIGLPHYDVYKEISKVLQPREAFFSSMGLDPSKKLILYGAMGDLLFPHEGDFADIFEELIESGKINDAQILFRAHPKFKSPLERMKTMLHVKPDRCGTYLTQELKSVEMDEDDMNHLINSIYHADIVVSGASTFAMDGAVLNKPTICVGFDGNARDVPYWISVKRFYDCYTHFEAFMETGVAPLARDKEELVLFVNKALAAGTPDMSARQKMLDRFVEPFDGGASERLERLWSEEVSRRHL